MTQPEFSKPLSENILGPVSEKYMPTPGHILTDVPVDKHYATWGYTIAYETDEHGQNVPEGGNTAIFRIAPRGPTEPVYVTKPDPKATFTVNVLEGEGLFIRATKDGQVEETPLKKGGTVVVRPGDLYSYKNLSDSGDLVLHDEALPAFQTGDDVEVTQSVVPNEPPHPRDGYLICNARTSDGGTRLIEEPTAFADAMARAMSNVPD
ncbi:MAG TPA: hypothetical protein VF261_02025 [Candidatus Saccharimonadales bacterium]